MTPKLQKIIFTIIALVILFVIYAVFIKPDPTTDSLVTGRTTGAVVSSQEARLLGSQIAQALLKIEQITLDRTIFDNAIFVSLQDRSQPIVEEPVGRTNPFAPIGDTSVNVTTRTNLNVTTATTTATTTKSVTATTTTNKAATSSLPTL
jgi:hypothetical protein